jgi:transposase
VDSAKTLDLSDVQQETNVPDIRVFCLDESRFGILPCTRRRITGFGIKPVCQIDYQYDWFYLYGAVESKTGEAFFLQLPRLTGDCFQIFINQLSETYSESLNLVLLDNGRFHRGKSLCIPENIIFIFLPPYSPELNPIERLWQDIKDDLPLTCESLAQVSEIIINYGKEQIKSLTAFSYFINAVNEI